MRPQMPPDLFGIGLTSTSLTDLERRILVETSPYAVVLFARNIASVAQFGELVAEVKSLSRTPPLFMIDQEGGRVDRLRNILPGLPSAQAFAEGERGVELSAWHGRLTGLALRWFDVEIDLAPVVDIRGEVAPKGLERRTFGDDPESVVELAGAFMRGLTAGGVASCLKHWPGIGEGSGDPHYGQTVIDKSLDALLARELVPYARLASEAGAVMVGHGIYPGLEEIPDLPATLSRRLTTDLLRNTIGFQGLAVSDDMEMHAVSDLGTYEEITERALMAGNDVILFCSHIERVPDLQSHLRRRVEEDAAVRARFEEAARRCDVYRAHCERLRVAAPAPRSWAEVLDESDAFDESFQSARPFTEVVVPEVERRRNQRRGRTGREEWT
jgi:beta-N-acetylhexosaminidase